MQALTPLNPQTGIGQVFEADPRLKNLQKQDDAKMRESADAFEAQYVFQLMELMAPKIDREGMFSGGAAEENFRPQLHEAMAKQIVRQGGFGIAENVYKELLISQAAAAGVTVTPDQAAAAYHNKPEVTGEE